VEVRFSDGSVEQYNEKQLKAGAQGAIYISRDQRSVVKLYHPHLPKAHENRDRINKLITQFNPTSNDPYWAQFFTWPEKSVAEPGLGYRMRYVSGLRTLDHYIFSRAYERLPPEEKGWFIGRIATAIKLVTAADRLARMGLCYPDFSHKNVMVDAFAGHMVLIDCDSLTVPARLPAVIEGTSWYRAPELIAKKLSIPNLNSDRHALAVLLYQWLLRRHPLEGERPPLDLEPETDDILNYGEKALYTEHPTDKANPPSKPFISAAALGPELEKLFQTVFVDGLHNPAKRPQPYQWQQALQHTYDRLVPCSSPTCDWRFFVYNPTKTRLICPSCLQAVRTPSTLPIVHLHRQNAGRGDVHYLVGWPQRCLHQWHMSAGRSPFRTDPQNVPDNTPCAVFAYDQGQGHWFLKNLTQTSMSYRGNPTDQWHDWPINQSVRLEPQTEILFGKGSDFYRASIEMRQVQ
jgi:DNA-binding helix-hairpin-helix protein with protein kinase domain